eukprot:TRINITY_DN33448_c0_g1_i1.p1 TRINITY_DN33448_c0_g1~~TRINITY_DN33448_c0_g1_i1.p1  ORF type:complete len:401 (-),score=53.88 TRINITY_DN33448_c0_g1_i1:1-1203(-)
MDFPPQGVFDHGGFGIPPGGQTLMDGPTRSAGGTEVDPTRLTEAERSVAPSERGVPQGGFGYFENMPPHPGFHASQASMPAHSVAGSHFTGGEVPTVPSPAALHHHNPPPAAHEHYDHHHHHHRQAPHHHHDAVPQVAPKVDAVTQTTAEEKLSNLRADGAWDASGRFMPGAHVPSCGVCACHIHEPPAVHMNQTYHPQCFPLRTSKDLHPREVDLYTGVVIDGPVGATGHRLQHKVGPNVFVSDWHEGQVAHAAHQHDVSHHQHLGDPLWNAEVPGPPATHTKGIHRHEVGVVPPHHHHDAHVHADVPVADHHHHVDAHGHAHAHVDAPIVHQEMGADGVERGYSEWRVDGAHHHHDGAHHHHEVVPVHDVHEHTVTPRVAYPAPAAHAHMAHTQAHAG